MRNALRLTFGALLGLVFAAPLCAQITNGGFETGDFAGWTADPNWVIAKDSRDPLSSLPPSDPKKSLKLEDDRYLVEVSRSNGAITRILDKKGQVDLIREPRLADNFRFTLPIPGKEPWQTLEANYICGKQQKLSSFDISAKKLTLHWHKPLLNYLGERFHAAAAMGIELTPQGVSFSLRIDNPTRYQIGEVFFPLVGGIQGIGTSAGQLKATVLITPTSREAVSSNGIFRVFTNMSWLGDQGPEQYYSYPKDMSQPWMEFSSRKWNRSVYIGTRQSAHGSKVLRLELIPSNSATVREDGNWPRPSELQGQPVGVSVCFVDFVNSPAYNTYQAAPVLISFHDGDWHEAKRIYQNWKDAK